MCVAVLIYIYINSSIRKKERILVVSASGKPQLLHQLVRLLGADGGGFPRGFLSSSHS